MRPIWNINVKTVIARFSEVKSLYSKGELLGDVEGEEIDVNKVSKALRTAGINLNEYLTGMKGLDEIFMELSAKWDSLDQVQQRYIATMAAGSRQQSRFIALMQDNARMTELVREANNATGASQEQFNKTLESLETKLNQLKNAWDTFLMGLANDKAVKFVIDLLTKLIEVINKVTSGLPGLLGSFVKLSTAIVLFKLGKKILTGFFTWIKGEASKSGEEASNAWTNSFKNGITANGKTLRGTFSNFFKESIPSEQIQQQLRTVVFESLSKLDLKGKSVNDFVAAFDSGGIRSFIKALKDAGIEIDDLEAKLRKYQHRLHKTTISVEGVSTAFMSVGSALNLLSQAFDQETESGQKWSKTLSAIGSVLMGVGSALITVNTIVKLVDKTVRSSTIFIITAIIAAVATGIYFLIKALQNLKKNTPEGKLKAAKEAAEEAAKAAEDAKTAYDSLNSSLESLGDKYKSIEDLTKGTQAWKDAVYELNQQVLTLLEKYPELEEFVAFDSSKGYLVLDLDSTDVQSVLDQYRTRSITASAYSTYKSADVINKAIDNAWDKISEGLSKVEAYKDDYRISVAGKFIEDRYGDSGLAAYNYEREITEDIAKKIYLEQLKTPKEIQKYAEDLKVVIGTTEDNIKALKAFGAELVAGEKQLKAYSTTQATDIIQLQDLSGEAADVAFSYLTESNKDLVEKYYKDIENEFKPDDLRKNAEYLAWVKSTYGLTAEVKDSKGKIEYTKDGQTVTLESDRAKKEYIYFQALQKAGKVTEDFANRVLKSSDILTKAYTTEGLGLNKEELEELKSPERLYKQLYGENADLNSEEYKRFEEEINHFYKVVTEAFAKAEEDLKRTGFDEPISDWNLTAAQTSDLSEVIMSVLATSGRGAAEEVMELIPSIAKDKIGPFIEALGMLKLDNVDDIQNFEEILKDLGLNIPTTTEEFQDLRAKLLAVAEAAQQVNVEKIQQAIEALQPIRAKFAKDEATRTWTADEFEAMKPYLSSDLLSGFVQDMDGNYVYLGNSMDDLKKAIEDNTAALREQEIEALEDQITAQGILQAGMTYTIPYSGGVLQSKAGAYDFDLVTGDSSKLNNEEKKQIVSYYLQQLKENFTPEQLQRLGLKISRDTTIDSIVDSGKLDDYFSSFIMLATNTALESEKERLENEDAVRDYDLTLIDELIDKAVTDAAAYQQLQLRGITAGITNGDYLNASAEDLGSIVKTFQEATKLGFDTTLLEEYAQELQKINTELDDELALRVALANTKLNTGLKEIIDSYKDWTELIDKTGKISATASDEIEIFNKLKKSVNEMLNTSEDLSDEFWNNAKNVELIKEAAEGSVDAIAKLQKIAAADYVLNVTPEIDTNKTESELESLISQISKLILETDLPTLEPGVELKGYDEFIQELGNMMLAAGYSVKQIEDTFENLGFVVEWGEDSKTTWSEYLVPKKNNRISGGATYEFDDYEVVKMPTTVSTPYIKGLRSTGSGGGGVSQKNITAGQANKPSSSGKSSSGSSSKPSYWKNPYDELFNLQERINEALREREALERRYQKLLKSSSATIDQIRRGYREQIEHLKTEINLQRQLAQGRLNQIHNLANQYYTDSEGNRRTYASLGVTRYASYNEQTGLLQIDWDRLEQIANDASRTAEGEAAEAYINALQTLVDSYEDVRDAIWDIEDKIDDLNKELIESYTSFEDRVMDALVARYEKEIDSLEKIHEAINDATSKVLDGIQKEIDAQRQERQNQKTEEEIAEKEARLAYLRLDTSGANSLEIMQLEKELEDMRQDYEDSLIDQALQQMRDEADLAAEQRAEQIELMRAQLEIAQTNGELWPEVYDLIASAFDEEGNIVSDSELVQLLRLTDGASAMSEVGQLQWWQDYVAEINEFRAGVQAVMQTFWNNLSPELQAILEAIGGEYSPITGGNNGSGSGGSSGGNNGGNLNPPTQTPAEIFAALTWALAHLGYLMKPGTNVSMTWEYFADHYDIESFNKMVEEGVILFQTTMGINPDGRVGNQTRSKFAPRFATGGLADFTGPAWLDGSRSHPELVLNSQDTQNFVALKDILSHIFTSITQNKTPVGDAYFDIDINAEIDSDYDVDQLVNRLKDQILRDAHYRNVNMVNLMK